MISSNLRFISLCRLSIRLFKYSHLSLTDAELYITLVGLELLVENRGFRDIDSSSSNRLPAGLGFDANELLFAV